jgi:hypothetical protein
MIQQSVQAALYEEQRREDQARARAFEVSISAATTKAATVSKLAKRTVDAVNEAGLDPAFSEEARALDRVARNVLSSARASMDPATAGAASGAVSQTLSEITALYQRVQAQAALAVQKRRELELAQATEAGLAKQEAFQEALLALRQKTRSRLIVPSVAVAPTQAEQAELDVILMQLQQERAGLERDKQELARLLGR